METGKCYYLLHDGQGKQINCEAIWSTLRQVITMTAGMTQTVPWHFMGVPPATALSIVSILGAINYIVYIFGDLHNVQVDCESSINTYCLDINSHTFSENEYGLML